MLQDFHTKRYTGASFSKSIQKSLVGLKILTRDQMHTGSGSSGNVVEHGLRSKLLRSFRVNGSALCLQRLDQTDVLSWQWIDYHERIVVQIWHTKQGVFRRKLPPDVRDDPMRESRIVFCLHIQSIDRQLFGIASTGCQQ